MKSFGNIFFFCLFSQSMAAQNDPEALKILDRFSDNALRAPSISMKFKLINTNLTDNTKDTINGSVIINKDKYKLDLPDNTVWYNGETSWSYLTVEKEVTITKTDKKDNTFQSRPSLIFSMYKKGYKSRLIEDNQDSYIIDLYPEDIKSELMRIRLTIGKSLLNLISLEYKRKDGVINTLQINDFNLNVRTGSDTFVFQKEKFKDVEVIDMR
jgi:outer membrane lipoprotein carrier protein